ncbi:hypothetical protein LZ198_37790 [Myxococcus sp. K15C18031901]|uniref:TPR end-of-group domain-containing protein n=1 Tax=Myxococcus dinghuensis TaxID=2906761 RepID=UPI0020A7EBCC|nr:hypothetical protein [Myxococcus dinghuensis]MCP3104632.1 hypothetical protein [Myxococcus dinghuensis]
MRPLVVVLAVLNLVACAGRAAAPPPGEQAPAASDTAAPSEGGSALAPTDSTRVAIDADVAFRKGDMFQALALYRKAWAAGARQASVAYNAACAASVAMEREEALGWLERAVDAGFDDLRHLQGDPDLANVRMLPGYAGIVERLRSQPPREAPESSRGDETMAPAD